MLYTCICPVVSNFFLHPLVFIFWNKQNKYSQEYFRAESNRCWKSYCFLMFCESLSHVVEESDRILEGGIVWRLAGVEREILIIRSSTLKLTWRL